MPKRLIKLPKIALSKYIAYFKVQPGYVIMITMIAVGMSILMPWLLIQNQQINRNAITAKVLAVKTRDLAKENAHLLKKVQNNRRDLIYKNCRDQNIRHRGSLKALRSLLKKSGVNKARQDQAFAQTAILINALVPHRNCVELANNTVKPPTKKLPGS